LDLTGAVVVVPPEGDGLRGEAVRALREEVAARTGVRWPEVQAAPPPGVPAVVLHVGGDPACGADALAPEGFRVRAAAAGDAPGVLHLTGADGRGLLYAVGHLLRHAAMGPGRIQWAGPSDLATAPRSPLRGHQLGYRPKNNTYDAWSPEQFAQYIRELALFGANTIELLPPHTDDADVNPLMRYSKEEMLSRVTGAIDRLGLAVGLWYPLLAADVGDVAAAAAELATADGVFGLCARLDHVFVPGGDPGHTPPQTLLPFLAHLAECLHRRHPRAGLWVSGQGFPPAQLAEFFALLRRQRPPWLRGVVYGPWTACSLREMREALPPDLELRLYPDIAHTIHCQFPVPAWDPAYMATLGREPINPLPCLHAAIARAQLPGTCGFVSYSEGVNDDVNKFVWTAVAWDPQADVGEVLRQYARLLVLPRHAEAVAQAILALERHWEGPLWSNAEVPRTLRHLQGIEATLSPAEAGNWRWQSLLYRAYADAYVQCRLQAAAAREHAARRWLARTQEVGVDAALQGARQALVPAGAEAPPAWRARLDALADGLFAGIGMQLSVSRHGASGEERGANLEALDAPLGEGPWLEDSLARIAEQPTAAGRAEALAAWEAALVPAAGGFLDDLGQPGSQPHLVGGMRPPHDPDFVKSVLFVPTPSLGRGAPARPRIWQLAAETLYGAPLELAYEHLDPGARYRLRVLYHGRYRAAVSLEANGWPVHAPLRPSEPPEPVAFDLPLGLAAQGRLRLRWRLHQGRGIQVAAVWLEPAPDPEPCPPARLP
jgi:hypothetical protein